MTLSDAKPSRGRTLLSAFALQAVILLATLAVLEAALRIADFRYLRREKGDQAEVFRFDPNLGWSLIPNAKGRVLGARHIEAEINSRGFRDIEHAPTSKPTVLFVGDS